MLFCNITSFCRAQGASRNRVGRLIGLFVIGLSMGISGCTAEHPSSPPPNQWMEAFASPFLEMNAPPLTQELSLRHWISQSPWFTYEAGLESDQVPAECQFRNYRLLRGDRADAAPFPLFAQYLRDCESEILNGPTDFVRNLYRTLQIRFPLEQHPYFHRVTLHLPNGYRLPGLVALKDRKSRRPWVVLRAGIFGNSVDMQAERFLLIQLFEQGHFNVLFLDSMTGAETLRLNSQLSVGGLDEGIQNYQVASRLLNSEEPLHRLVESVHLAAISMGGHGLFMAMILNEVNPPVFRNAVALCPLVQMQKTFSGLERTPFFFGLVNLYSSFRMPELFRRVPEISRWTFLADSFDWVAKSYQGPLTFSPGLRFPPGFASEDFVKGNDLLPWLKGIRRPIAILASQRDHLVPYDLNSGLLADQKSELPNIHVYPLRESFHCTLPGAYSWSQTSQLLNAMVLADPADSGAVSTGMPNGFRRLLWPLKPMKAGDEVTAEREFELRPGDELMTARVKKKRGSDLIVQIPIGALGWGTAERIRTESEARALLRWSQQFVQVEASGEGRLSLQWPVPPGFHWDGPEGVIQ